MSTLPASYQQFVHEMSPVLAEAGVRWAAVIVSGYAPDDVRSLGEAADLATDSAADVYGTAAGWLVVDTASGESRTGGPRQRAVALSTLRRHYAPDTNLGHDAPDWAGERTILVSRHLTTGQHRLVAATKVAPAFQLAAEQVLEGWLPLATVDLDLGRLTELRVAAPVVTPTKEQGVMVNPLVERA